MYVKHPFEWVILYCAYTPDPVETFHELLSQRYADKYIDFNYEKEDDL